MARFEFGGAAHADDPVRRHAARLFDLLVGGATVALYAIAVVPSSRIRGARRRKRGVAPSIVWGPIPVVNIVYSVQADRLHGYRSESLVYGVYSINARDQYDHVLDRWARIPLLGHAVPYAAFLWAGLRHDVFGFFFDGGLLWATPFWRAELALLRLAGKRVVVYPYGSDARLASVVRESGRWHAYTDVPKGEEDRREDQVRARLAAFGRYANVVLGCADLYEELPRVDGILRYPFDQTGWEPTPALNDGVVRIVHAPNHRHYKGTRYLLKAVEQLHGEGLPVELQLIEGVPTQEARQIYAEADIIADQFLIGAYALFAIEGMALGKPVVCRLDPRFLDAHPEWTDCPIVSADPDTLAQELRRLVLDRELREEIGARGPAYVRRYHSLESVGADMDAIYRRLWS
jgi:glycosyltransferase involved in cell wall biosynthesis